METTREKTTSKRLERLAREIFRAALPHVSSSEPGFRMEFFMDVEGQLKPVVLIGTAHPLPFEDGHCIALLNPELGLEFVITPSTGFAGGLKGFVAGRCDEAIQLWHDAYKNNGSGDGSVIDRYKARVQSPPRRHPNWRGK